MEKEKATLHFTRMRAKGDPSFYDPNTDIRSLLPSLVKTSLIALEEQYKDNEDLVADFNYLHNCFCIFQIRLTEDPTPCLDQVLAFFDAVSKVPKKHLFLWLDSMSVLMTCIYGLFVRRDTKTDGAAIAEIINTACAADTLRDFPVEQRKTLDAAKLLKVKSLTESFDTRGYAVCEETGKRLENIKQLAALFVPHTGSHSWEALSAACDEQFYTTDVKSDEQTIALALAYPDYTHRDLSVEVTKDDTER